MKELVRVILQYLKLQMQSQRELIEAINRLSDLVAAERETEAVRGPDGKMMGARSRIKKPDMMQ